MPTKNSFKTFLEQTTKSKNPASKLGLTWYGGKKSIVDWVLSHMPLHKAYFEPFGGGLSVFFNKPIASYNVLNDKEERLIRFYQILLNENYARKAVETFSNWPRSEELFFQLRKIIESDRFYLQNPSRYAAAFYYVTYFSFLYSLKTYQKNQQMKGISSKTRHFYNLIDVFKVISNKGNGLEHAEFRCMDGIALIEKAQNYHKNMAASDVLIYCDPPYVGTYQKYKNKFNHEDLDNLISVAKASPCKVMISTRHAFTREQSEGMSMVIKQGTLRGLNGKQTLERIYANFPLENDQA